VLELKVLEDLNARGVDGNARGLQSKKNISQKKQEKKSQKSQE
jgi:hypothetical protein